MTSEYPITTGMELELTMERDPLALDDDEGNQPGDNLFCCQVCNMLLIGFSKYSDVEKLDIIKSGRPRPKMESLIWSSAKGFTRRFNPTGYDTYEWLTGCERRSKLFCWACLLFADNTNLWNTTGVSDLNNLHKSMKTHSVWYVHIQAMLKWKTFGKIGLNVDESSDIVLHNKRSIEETILKNREVLKKLVRLVCFLSNHELPPKITGEIDPTDPLGRNKYADFVRFMSKFDESLKKMLNKCELFLKPNVCNSILVSVTNVIHKKIKEEIYGADFVSLIFDEAAELGETILVSTTVRYALPNGLVRERFLNFQEVPSTRQAGQLFEIIRKNVNFLNCASKVVSQSYDGTVIRAAELFTLQGKVHEICPNALLLHYSEHRLSSVMKQSLSTIKECKYFFSILDGLCSTFLKSKKLSNELNTLIRRSKPGAPNFQWKFDGCFFRNILEIRLPLIDLFENIVKTEDGWDFETVFVSAGFFTVLSTEVMFNMLLLLLSPIFVLADELSEKLKGTMSDTKGCIEKSKEFANYIKKKRGSFYLIHEEALRLVGDDDPPTKKMKAFRNADEYYNVVESVISNLTAQVTNRFNDLSTLKFISLSEFKNSKDLSGSPEVPLTSLRTSFLNSFDVSALCSELNVIFESEAFNTTNAKGLLLHIRRLSLTATLPQTVRLCLLNLTLPVACRNSTFQRFQNYVKNSSIGHKLSLMAILTIEKDMVDTCLEQSQFYVDVIDEFAKIEPTVLLRIE